MQHDSTAPSLVHWCKTLSWSKCENCNSIIQEKLLPSFIKLQKSETKIDCHCANDKYIVPLLENIPTALRSLTGVHVQALRPFDIDCGHYKCMKYGYRKKTGVLRLSCSKEPVESKIAMLSSAEDRSICTRALHFPLSNSSSSYNKFYAMRNDFLANNTQPNYFDVYKWEGIECVLWPNLYPFTSWCDTIHDGSLDRRGAKISFIKKCLSQSFFSFGCK